MMKIEIKNHLLFIDDKQVPFYDTPNKSGKTMVPSYIICHFTADNNPLSTIGWFMDKAAVASAHLLIDRAGKVYQFGKFNMVLWHAGKSEWLGTEGMNSRSVGIEMTNLGRTKQVPGSILATHKNESTPSYWQQYTPEQTDVCAAVSKVIYDTYKMRDILGHDDIAPNRKQDPGPAFPWDKIYLTVGIIQKTNTDGVNLRPSPGTLGTPLTSLPKGSNVVVRGHDEGWTNVNWNGKYGWILNKYLV